MIADGKIKIAKSEARESSAVHGLEALSEEPSQAFGAAVRLGWRWWYEIY